MSYEPLLAQGQVFCSVTAAALLQLPLPQALLADTHLHVGKLGGQGPRRRGVVGHRLPLNNPLVEALGGFTVTDAASTWCQLATTLSGADLVAVGDCLISGNRRSRGVRSQPLATLPELQCAVEIHGRRRGRGAASLRWALERVRYGVDSPQETRLRLTLVEHGFAEPAVGVAVPVEGGALTLHPDLAWPDLRIVFEYEGDEHRTNKKRFRADIRRREMFEAAGWRVVRVTADDLGAELNSFIARVQAIVTLRRADLAR